MALTGDARREVWPDEISYCDVRPGRCRRADRVRSPRVECSGTHDAASAVGNRRVGVDGDQDGGRGKHAGGCERNPVEPRQLQTFLGSRIDSNSSRRAGS